MGVSPAAGRLPGVPLLILPVVPRRLGLNQAELPGVDCGLGPRPTAPHSCYGNPQLHSLAGRAGGDMTEPESVPAPGLAVGLVQTLSATPSALGTRRAPGPSALPGLWVVCGF